MKLNPSLLRQWDWGLYLLIFLYMGLPQIYRSYSVYLIGNAIPDTNALATVAQWQFMELLLEVVQETFVLAIFFFVGRSLQNSMSPGYPIRTAYTIIFLFSTFIAAIIFALSGSFVDIIGTPKTIQETTSLFLKIKSAGIPIVLLSTASVIMIETINRKKLILATAVLSVLYRAILDSLFYGGYPFSLNLGVLGVAWSDTIAALALLITIFFLVRPMIRETMVRWSDFFSFKDWKTYVKVGFGSGLDSLVRNFAYFFMIVRLLNLLGENAIGGYYLAMHIFWSFLLVPILALSESAKVLIANHCADLHKVRTLWAASMLIGVIIVVAWLVLVPFWRDFAEFLNPNDEFVNYSVRAMLILLIPYVLLAFNLITDSIFYGVGRTKYMAYQSIITNGTVYVAAFSAYIAGVWTPTFNSILWLFSMGILVDSALTLYLAFHVLFPRDQLRGAKRIPDLATLP
ncbi:MAG: MATE family efflux transporter [Chloroflexi bacterium]|nr:MATE family efflux transporter [Chloroflexota bacterium]